MTKLSTFTFSLLFIGSLYSGAHASDQMEELSDNVGYTPASVINNNSVYAENNDASPIPAGCIMPYAGLEPPEGWLLCHGQPISIKNYERLYRAIGSIYTRQDQEDMFCVPDLKGRMVLGADFGAGRVTANSKISQSGGEEMHTLSVEEMPEHKHGVFAYGSSLAYKADGYKQPKRTRTLDFSGYESGGFVNSDAAGGNRPHNNMPPYLTMNYIIKY